MSEEIKKPTRGLFLIAHGKRGYYYAAYNFAFSVKHFNPDIQICLFHDGQIEKELCYPWMPSVFDKTIQIPDEILWHGGKMDPAYIKIMAYHFHPFDITLQMDVECQAFQDLNVIFDELEKDGGYFYSQIIGTYTVNDGRELGNMVWAYGDDIWNHFNLKNDAILPATNSSFQYWKKCEQAKELHDQLEHNFDFPIPIDRLRYAWGGTQPDELYLNVALAQKGLIGKTPRDYLFMGNASTDCRQEDVMNQYPIMCFFGNQNQTRPFFIDWYDGDLIRWHSQKGLAHFLKYHLIQNDKHANNARLINKNPDYTDDIITEQRHGEKINLFLSFFKDKEPLRNAELLKVLKLNVDCSEIENIYLLSEQDIVLPEEINQTKIHIVKMAKRTTYLDCVNLANNVLKDDFTISIIANADIYFDDRNLRLIKELDFSETTYALSRWDIESTGKPRHFSYEWSQDTWIFKGRIPDVECDWIFGVPACDNRFANELKKHFRRVANPSNIIKTYHLHNSDTHNYSEADRLAGSVMSISPEGVKPYRKKTMLMIQKGKVGDVLICLPIARELAKTYIIDWMLPHQYHNLFSGVDYVRPVDEAKRPYDRTLDLSFGQGGQPEAWWQKEKHRFNSFVTAKYELAGIPIQKRKPLIYTRNIEKENALMEIINQRANGKDYILTHESSDYGDPITIEAVAPLVKIKFEPIEGFTIFDWREVIMNAKQIHVIDSSLCNFVELLDDAVMIPKYYYKTTKVPSQWDETILENNWKRNQEIGELKIKGNYEVSV